MASPLAVSLLQVIRKAPQDGLDVLASLLRAGHFDLEAPIDAAGTSFCVALHQASLDRKTSSSKPANPLFIQLYSKAGLDRWDPAQRLRLYGQCLPDGRSIPQAVFDLCTSMSAARSKQDENPRRMVESWCQFLLPSLSGPFLDRHGGELLASAMEHYLHAAASSLWQVVGPLAQDRHGRPALLRARRHEQWHRYLKQHGSLEVVLADGRPLWEHLLDQSLATQKPSPFQRAFEQWLSQQPDSRMRQRIPGLAQLRLASPSATPASQWIDMFRASGAQWLSWRAPRPKDPAWLVVCCAHPDLAMFDALSQAPDLLAQLPQDQFKLARLVAQVMNIVASGNGKTIQAGIARLDQLVAEGLPENSPAIVSMLDPKKVSITAAQALGEWSIRHQDLWWGDPDRRDEQSQRLAALLLSSEQRKHDQLTSWKALCQSAPTPWLRVAMGFAGTIAGKNAPLLSVDPAEGACVIQHPDGQAWLDGMVKVFSPRRRKLLMPWMEAARLEAYTAQTAPTTSRSTLRL